MQAKVRGGSPGGRSETKGGRICERGGFKAGSEGVALYIFVICDRKDFKFSVHVECASHSLRTTNRP